MKSKPLAVFDVDGTIYRWSLFHELIERLGREGLIAPVHFDLFQEILEAKLDWQNRILSYAEYNRVSVSALLSGYLADISYEHIHALGKEILRETGDRVYVFTRELIFVLHKAGYHTLAISGSPQDLVRQFTEKLGFDGALGTEIEVKDGQLTGKCSEEVFADKAGALKKYVAQLEEPHEVRVALGDTANDLCMLRLADYPIAFNPDQKLKEEARRENIPVVFERKDSITPLIALGGGLRDLRGPPMFSETTLSTILPSDIARELRKRLQALHLNIS